MNQRFQRLGAMLALLATFTTTAVAAAPPASRDLVLSSQGELRGQVYSNSGQPKASTVALVRHGAPKGTKPTLVETDDAGKFSVANVTPGVYDLICEGHGGTVRVWDNKLAPPKAHDAAMIVVGKVERGQFPWGGGFWSNPLWLTGLVAAAIAIPLALSDDSGS